ncbi:agamous-like MADS-box protein AGL30 [Heracleum sosnowskyi]|uniref:Agamous-like MADS-box protein AGL30 n=1 Tax=Heracleum sosnowskyi TaxID=360622 RepID=A0AAD8HZR4_9APIA|nr:agamous-like MADS-box protein AGL30 [Heracleum sosnowskyi]
MGRVKLKIQKLENSTGRQSTYSKRKNGLTKKAKELAILCDIDLVLLMFSPSGKPSVYKGQHSSIEKIIERYSLHTPQERARRRLESLEALKKTFKKTNHDVQIQDFLGPNYISVEDLRSQAESLHIQLFESQKKLSNWTSIDTMDSIENLGHMELSLRNSLDQLQAQKVNLEKQQQMDIQCFNKFQDDWHPSSSLGFEQLQPLQWAPNSHSQQITPNNLTSFPLREPECSVGTSLESYNNILNLGTKDWQQGNVLAELNSTGSINLQPNNQLNLQVHEQQIYPSSNFDLLNDQDFLPVEQMNMQANTLEPLSYSKYEVPKSVYDPFRNNWDSNTAGNNWDSNTETIEKHLFPQFHFSSDDNLMNDLDYMLLKAAPHSSLMNQH